jgi:hypothetical protein
VLTARKPKQLRREQKENMEKEMIGLKKCGFFSEEVPF